MSLIETPAIAMPPPASEKGRMAIVAEGLRKRFGRGSGAVDAVIDLDLAVRRGEVFGLLGPNGAGKTTTIGMLTTRVVPTGGRALVAGVDVAREPARVKQHIGVVSQSNTLDRSLTVRENLVYHGRYFGLGGAGARSRADELLERFQLVEKRDAMPGELSGGMAQRLLVARAVLHRPAVLFLDEPTTGLDPQARLALWELLRELHTSGQTILVTTHYMEEADQLCERVAIVDGGRLLALGTPDALKRQIDVATVVTLTVDGDAAGLAAELESVEGVCRASDDTDRVRVQVEQADGVLPGLVMAAERAGCRVRDLTVTAPTLETVFIALTGKELRE